MIKKSPPIQVVFLDLKFMLILLYHISEDAKIFCKMVSIFNFKKSKKK